jgi:hypothetical protein
MQTCVCGGLAYAGASANQRSATAEPLLNGDFARKRTRKEIEFMVMPYT